MSAWLWLFLSLFLVFSPPRAVTIIDFHAEGHSDRVEIFWTTVSEINNAGFNLHRATSQAGPFTKINLALIPGEGDPITGASYQFTDSNVEPGVTYYYKLEAIDLGGQSQWHDQIASATVPSAPTATPTATSTSTPTATATRSPTDTPVPTVSGSPTPYAPATAPGGDTATPTTTTTGTPAVTSTPTVTGTPTPTFTESPAPSPSAVSPTTTHPPGATVPPTEPPTPSATWTPPAVVTPPSAGPTSTAGPMPSATWTPAPTAPPSPSPTSTPTPFPTVPPQQPSSLSGICMQSLSYVWLIAGAAVLLVLVVGFVVLMTRGQRGEP